MKMTFVVTHLNQTSILYTYRLPLISIKIYKSLRIKMMPSEIVVKCLSSEDISMFSQTINISTLKWDTFLFVPSLSQLSHHALQSPWNLKVRTTFFYDMKLNPQENPTTEHKSIWCPGFTKKKYGDNANNARISNSKILVLKLHA